MPTILSTLTLPFLLLLSAPLALFALWTTTLAFWILLFRVSATYAELFAALTQAYLIPSSLTRKTPHSRPSSPIKPSSFSSRKSSRSSSIGSGILHHRTTPLMYHKKSQSTATLAAGGGNGLTLTTTGGHRDYEGVGGWRLQGEDEEEALWMGMNSRLELPASSRSHRGSWLVGLASGQVSPEAVRTPSAWPLPKTPGRGGSTRDGTASPESYFGYAAFGGGGGMTGLGDRERGGSRVSFSLEEGGGRMRPGSLAGSTASLGSVVKVMQREGW